jgi:small subunit ribosomal protein S4e
LAKKRIPYVVTHDGRTIRYPDPLIESNDTVKVDIESGKITDFIKFDAGNVVMVTKGRSTGRVGTIVSVEKHPGSFDIVTIKDAKGSVFATRLQNVFVIGKGKTPWVSLPPGNGIKLSILDEKNSRSEAQN